MFLYLEISIEFWHSRPEQIYLEAAKMAVSISISSTLLTSTPRSSLSSSLSSSNSVFFNPNQSRKFLSPLRSSSIINTSRSRKGFSCNCLFGLGVPELVVIAGVAALVFGPKKLPEVGRSIGKTVKSFQQVLFLF